MILSRLKCFSVLAVPVLALASIPMHAASLLSENFDELTPVLSATTAGPFSAIGGTNVDIVGGSNFGSLCSGVESGNCIDLGGTGGNPYGNFELTTTLSLTPGLYDLSFDLIGSGRGDSTSTTVFFGDFFNQTFVLGSSDVEVFNQLIPILGTSAQLQFVNNHSPAPGASPDGNIGALLDNVSVTAAPAPEPSSLMLLGTGIVGMAGMVRRKLMA